MIISSVVSVEVLNTDTLQWSTAADLPKALSYAPAAVCGDQVYVIGESSMYTCSVIALSQSHRSFLASLMKRDAGVWKKVAAPPVTDTTCLSISGQLVAIGGKDVDEKLTAAVYMYNPSTDSWEVNSHMGTPRRHCIAALLPNNLLMVVGGHVKSGFVGGSESDSVEVAIILK